MVRTVFVVAVVMALLAAGALTATAGSSHRSDAARLASFTGLTRAMGQTASDGEKATAAATAQSLGQTLTAQAQADETEAQNTNDNDDVGEPAENGATAQAAEPAVQAPTGEKDDEGESGDD